MVEIPTVCMHVKMVTFSFVLPKCLIDYNIVVFDWVDDVGNCLVLESHWERAITCEWFSIGRDAQLCEYKVSGICLCLVHGATQLIRLEAWELTDQSRNDHLEQEELHIS